jgi:hypothetical protein
MPLLHKFSGITARFHRRGPGCHEKWPALLFLRAYFSRSPFFREFRDGEKSRFRRQMRRFIAGDGFRERRDRGSYGKPVFHAVFPSLWMSPSDVLSLFALFRQISYSTTRPYVPLFSKTFGKNRPFLPPQSPKVQKNARFVVAA